MTISRQAWGEAYLIENETFTEDFSLANIEFSSDVVVRDCVFKGDVDFSHSIFNGRFEFLAEVAGTATFDHAEFTSDAILKEARFASDVRFRDASFLWDVDFNSAYFGGKLNFRRCDFRGYVDFEDAVCKGRVKFLDATLRDELRLNNAELQYVKHLGSQHGVAFDGAIVHQAHFGDLPSLTNYSFRGAYLLSCSFAGMELNSCDFTGAVFSSVDVDEWRPDESTLDKTKFIYTGYLRDSENNYEPDPQSRVPLTGEFGDAAHDRFNLVGFLAERSVWQIAVDLPPEIRGAIINYVNFFPDFMRIIDGSEVEIRSRREGSNIRLEFVCDSGVSSSELEQRLYTYFENIGRTDLDFEVRARSGDALSKEDELFKIRYEYQITTLKTELRFHEQLLMKEEGKNELLLSKLLEFNASPQSMLPVPPRRFETNIHFMSADLEGYSAATRSDPALAPEIQSLFLKTKRDLAAVEHCEVVKLEGDCVKVFSRDGVACVWIAMDLIHAFDRLSRSFPSSSAGFRVVLGYGLCTREQLGAEIDFSGQCIIDTVRIDQPMKHYLKTEAMSGSHLWCTQAFRDALFGRHPKINFKELPPMALDKGHQMEGNLFEVFVE